MHTHHQRRIEPLHKNPRQAKLSHTHAHTRTRTFACATAQLHTNRYQAERTNTHSLAPARHLQPLKPKPNTSPEKNTFPFLLSGMPSGSFRRTALTENTRVYGYCSICLSVVTHQKSRHCRASRALNTRSRMFLCTDFTRERQTTYHNTG